MTDTSAEVQAERLRCADWCERMALLFDAGAENKRKEGTFSGAEISFSWPPFKRRSFVHPNWERAALANEAAASTCRTIKRAILEGWIPKP